MQRFAVSCWIISPKVSSSLSKISKLHFPQLLAGGVLLAQQRWCLAPPEEPSAFFSEHRVQNTFRRYSMKRIVLIALLALALPLSAFADPIDFTNLNGTFFANIIVGGLHLNSQLLNVYGLGLGIPGNLGTVSFSTGAFLGGNLLNAVTFSEVGSTFTIRSKGGVDGLPPGPAGGIIFIGAFTSLVTWTPEGNGIYQIAGAISGHWWNGAPVSGFTSQLYSGTVTGPIGDQTFTGILGSGNTIFTPEPGTLGLLGIGLVGLAGVVRRKLKTTPS
jgi:hypothetical protein